MIGGCRKSVFTRRCLHIPLGVSRIGGQQLVHEAGGLRMVAVALRALCQRAYLSTLLVPLSPSGRQGKGP